MPPEAVSAAARNFVSVFQPFRNGPSSERAASSVAVRPSLNASSEETTLAMRPAHSLFSSSQRDSEPSLRATASMPVARSPPNAPPNESSTLLADAPSLASEAFSPLSMLFFIFSRPLRLFLAASSASSAKRPLATFRAMSMAAAAALSPKMPRYRLSFSASPMPRVILFKSVKIALNERAFPSL